MRKPLIGKSLILMGFMALLFGSAKAQSFIDRRYFTTYAIFPDVHVQATDDRITNLSSGTGVDFRDKNPYGIVSVGFDPDMNLCYPQAVKYRITVQAIETIIATPGTVTTQTNQYTFTINYDPMLQSPETEQAFVVIPNARDIELSIVSVKTVDNAGVETPVADPTFMEDDVYAQVEIVRERYFNFNPTLPASVPTMVNSTLGDILTNLIDHNVHIVEWNNVDGAVEYELEWTYVDNFQDPAVAPEKLPGEIMVNFRNNASSVRLPRKTANKFFIPCIYSRGYVVWRVRAIGRGGPNLEDDIFGNWSTGESNLLSAVPANHQRLSSLIGYTPGISNFNNVNAQYSIEFAEDGKLLASGVFADGTLRTRQNVLAVKIDESQDYGKKAVITETIYDHMGREAITTLPAVTKTGLWYTPSYNQNAAGDKYSYKDFDTDDQLQAACVTGAEPMNELSSGAANYYSTNNSLKTEDFQGLIAEANGYPFIQTIFERDNTGKPKVQGDVGIDQRIGSGHETKYIYGGAEAVQINRLFGTDAGYPEYYQKNMVIDPNGQISITYTDMAGRTVATALAGKVPDNMQPLLDDEGNPLATSGDIVNDDLLNISDLHPNGSANPLSDDGKSYTLSTTLLIDKEQDYKFTYAVLLADFEDSCFTFCLDCIYDLELGLTDDCGKYYIGDNDSTTSLKLTLPAGLSIDTICNDTNNVVFPEFVVHLKPGSYSLYKKLSINETALSAYLDLMMANSDCLLPIDSFYVAPDTSGCYITCEACMENIGTWGDFFNGRKAAFNDDVLAENTLRPVYNAMKAECDAICMPASTAYDFCESIYRLMIMDMSPGGQYAQIDDDNAGNLDASPYPLSIFNTNNWLPQKRTGQFYLLPPASSAAIASVVNTTPDWRRPVYFDKSNPTEPYKAGYYDDMGQRERVYIELDENDNFFPPVVDPGQVVTVDPLLNQYFTFHENLLNVSDFLDRRPVNMAQSLVIYHPEFVQYSYCASAYPYTETVLGDVVNMFEFDAKLASMTYADATTLLGGSSTISDLFNNITAIDPFFNYPLSNAPYGLFPNLSAQNMLSLRFQNFQTLTGATTISEMAYIQNTCGYNYPFGCIGMPTTVWGGQIHNPATWETFVDYYISAKQEAILQAMVFYGLFGSTPGTPASWNKVINGCIGSDSYFPIFDLTASPGVILTENPCNFPGFIFYKQKQKRVGSTQSGVAEGLGLSDPPTLDELNQYATQGYYQQTGRCPMVSDLEFLLGKLTLERQSTLGPPMLTAGFSVDMETGGYLGTQLYTHINGSNVMYTQSMAGPTLTASLTDLECNAFTLTLPGAATSAGYGFDDIQNLFGIHNIGQIGSDYSFTVKAIFYNPAIAAMPETLDVTGTTCLPLTGCEAAFKSVCKPTDIAKDLMNLMSYISVDGELFNTTGYTLGSAPGTSDAYFTLVTARLRQYLGASGPYTWQYVPTPAPGRFILSGGGTQISLDLTGMGLTVGNVYQFTSILGAATSSPSSATFSDFTLTAVQVTPGSTYFPPMAGAPGTTTYSVTGNINVIGVSQSFPVTRCEPIRPIQCNTQEHQNLYELQEMLENWVDGIRPTEPQEGCIHDIVYSDPSFDMDNAQEVISLEADMSQSTNGVNSQYFTVIIKMDDNSIDTVWARYCSPLRNCVSCEGGPDTCRNAVFTIGFPGGYMPQENMTYYLSSKCLGKSFKHDYVGYTSNAQFWEGFANYIETNLSGVDATVVNATLVLTVYDPELLADCPCDSENNYFELTDGSDMLGTFTTKCCDPGPIPCEPHGIVSFGIAFPAGFTPANGEEISFSMACVNIKPSFLVYNHASITDFWTDFANEINTTSTGITAFVRNDSLHVVITDSSMVANCPCDNPDNNIAVKGNEGTIVRIGANCCDPRPKACEPNGMLTFGIHFPAGFTPHADEAIYLSGSCLGIDPQYIRYEQASIHDFWEAYGNAIETAMPGTVTFVRNDSLYIVITDSRILRDCHCDDPDNTITLSHGRQEVLAVFKASCCDPEVPCVAGSVSFDFKFPPGGLDEGQTVYFTGNCFNLKPDSYVYNQGSEAAFWLAYGADLESNMAGTVTTYANGVLHVSFTDPKILDNCPCNDPKNVITMTDGEGAILATYDPQCCNGAPVRCEDGGAKLYIPFVTFTMSPGDYFTINMAAFDCMGTGIAPLPYAHSDINSYLLDWASQIEAAHPGTVGAEVSGTDMYVYFAPSLFNAHCPCDEVYNSAPSIYKYDVNGNSNGNASVAGQCCEGGEPPIKNRFVLAPRGTGNVGRSEVEPEPEGGWDPWENPPITDDCHPDVFPFPQDPPLPNDCVQFLLETAQANAEYQYQQYLDQMREYYKQLYISKCMTPVRETFDREFQDGQYHYTLYYYDRAGNLVKTVPPRAVTPLTGADLTAVPNARDNNTVKVPEHNRVAMTDAFMLTTRARFNSLNQSIEVITPDGGKSNFYYDRLGRAAVSQNAHQYAISGTDKIYSYMIYDPQGRLVESGQMLHNTTATRTGIYNMLSSVAFFAYPFVREEAIRTVYDQAASVSFASGFTQNNLRSRISYAQTQPKGSTDFSFTTYYDYDIHGNVKSLIHENLLAPATPFEQNRVDYNYDLLSGMVKKISYNKGQTDQYFQKYEYDDQNRLVKALTSRNDYKYDLDAKYFYYWHGPLARIELGNNKVQGIDYAYTIHGWSKSVNSDGLQASNDPGSDGLNNTGNPNRYFAQDAYGYSLDYYEGDYNPIENSYQQTPALPSGYLYADLWNGNVAAMNSTLRNPNGYSVHPLLQRFGYDQLNRISKSESYNSLNPISNAWAPSTTPMQEYATSYTYDPSGNLRHLNRRGNLIDSLEMDSLCYKYYPFTNQLQQVRDRADDDAYHVDIKDQILHPNNYAYDEIGNLIKDENEEIASIEWTTYGKISKINRNPGSSKPNLQFHYDAAGRRVMKMVMPPNSNEFHYYYYVYDAQGNMLSVYDYYAQGSIEKYVISEQMLYGNSRLGSWTSDRDLYSYIPSSPEVYHVTRGEKHYELKDHLHSVHVTVSDRKKRICEDGELLYHQADIISANDYYAFGMQMPGRSFNKNCSAHKFVFGFNPNTLYLRLTFDLLDYTQQISSEFTVISSMFPTGSHATFQDGLDYMIEQFNAIEGTHAYMENDKLIIYFDECVYGNTVNLDYDLNVASGPNTLTVTHTQGEAAPNELAQSKYRFGFNGMEKVDETYGDANAYDFGARIYDPRLGRFFSIDPLSQDYPWYSPYLFAGNCPMAKIDVNGEEEGGPEKGEVWIYHKMDDDGIVTIYIKSESVSLGVQLMIVGNNRQEYDRLVKSVTDPMERFGLKVKFRQRDPTMFREVTEYFRPIQKEYEKALKFKREGGGNAGKSNPKVDKFGKNASRVGKGLVLLGVVVSTYNIATADDPAEQTVKEVFSWGGAIMLGETFAAGGALLFSETGPGAAIAGVVGGLIGGIVGGIIGEKAAEELLEGLKPPEPRKIDSEIPTKKDPSNPKPSKG